MPPAPSGTSQPRVLIVDSSTDTLDLLVEYFTFKNWQAHGVRASQVRSGEIDAGSLVATHAPDAIIFDVAIPYDVYWGTCHGLMIDPRVRCPIVITTTNEAALRRITGTTEPILEIIGKPYDLQRLFERVEVAVGLRADDRVAGDHRERRRAERRQGERRSPRSPHEDSAEDHPSDRRVH